MPYELAVLLMAVITTPRLCGIRYPPSQPFTVCSDPLAKVHRALVSHNSYNEVPEASTLQLPDMARVRNALSLWPAPQTPPLKAPLKREETTDNSTDKARILLGLGLQTPPFKPRVRTHTTHHVRVHITNSEPHRRRPGVCYVYSNVVSVPW